MANPLEALMQGAAPAAPADPTADATAAGPMDISAEEQRTNANLMGAPIPGQSLTREPGSAAWEQPPQYNTEAEAMDFLFEKVTRPDVQTNLLRVMDAGVPLPILLEPILMHGVQEGKWSMDLAMMLMEPLGVVLYGLGKRAGIDPKLEVPKKKEDKGINPESLAKIFKGAVEAKDQTAPKETEMEMPGLLARPGGSK